jgi:integrase
MYKVHRLTQARVDRTVKEVNRAREAGQVAKSKLVADGNGLYLQIPELSFISRLRFAGRRIEPGHGSARSVSLKDARAANEAARRKVAEGTNPVIARALARARASTSLTFLEAAQAFLPVIEAELKNAKSRYQWHTTLTGLTGKIDADGKPVKAKHNYCATLHPIPVADITTDLVLAVLNPIWSRKYETASRLRGRIERVLSWAVRQGKAGNIDPDRYLNPARWDGHLEHALSAKAKVHEVAHHAALHYSQMPAFYAALAKQAGLAARAFQLAILTATRTGDLRGVDREERPPTMWDHLDLTAPTWTVPKTKTSVRHRIPLSDAAVALLKQLQQDHPVDKSGIVFVGDKPGQPMSNGAMLAVRDRMVEAGLIAKGSATPHGMARAGFKSWASEETTFEKDVIEACLSHAISDEVEAAYRRTDFYRKRAKLMQAWADFVTGRDRSKVVPLPPPAKLNFEPPRHAANTRGVLPI